MVYELLRMCMADLNLGVEPICYINIDTFNLESDDGMPNGKSSLFFASKP
jgi:hypothetical protein